MEPIIQFCKLLYPEECCKKILVKFTLDQECLKMILIKSLGYGIILGSTTVKLPQLIKIFSAKSGFGVSLLSTFLELLALTFSSSYSFANGFPFSAWGEALFILFMTSWIAFLIIYYDVSKMKSFIFMVLFSIVFSVMMSGKVPIGLLWICQALSLPLIISSKLVQTWSNFVNKHTGNLSAITIIMIFIGSTTRILTSIKETGDQLIIFGFVISSIINLILVMQIFIYWNNTNEFIQKNLFKKET